QAHLAVHGDGQPTPQIPVHATTDLRPIEVVFPLVLVDDIVARVAYAVDVEVFDVEPPALDHAHVAATGGQVSVGGLGPGAVEAEVDLGVPDALDEVHRHLVGRVGDAVGRRRTTDAVDVLGGPGEVDGEVRERRGQEGVRPVRPR